MIRCELRRTSDGRYFDADDPQPKPLPRAVKMPMADLPKESTHYYATWELEHFWGIAFSDADDMLDFLRTFDPRTESVIITAPDEDMDDGRPCPMDFILEIYDSYRE